MMELSQRINGMKQQTVKFTIRQDGTITEEVMGTIGNECENLTKRIEERLGTVERVEHKPDYYQQKQTTEDNVTLYDN